MSVWQSMRIAWRGISSNKLRAFLTMLGIIIGVGAVIALLSIGQGVQASVAAQIQGTGSNLITITAGSSTSSSARVVVQGGGSQASLTSQDAEAIMAAQLPSVAAVSPEFSTSGQVQYGSQSSFGSIVGATPDYLIVHNVNIANGDFISQAAIDGVSQVVVLGATLATSLFGDQDPVGQTVKLNRANYRVIGVLEAQGGAFLSVDKYAIVPLSAAQKRLMGANRGFGTGQRVSTIGISAVSDADVDTAMADVSEILRTQHKIQSGQDDFTVISNKQILGALDQVTGILTAFLGAIAAISLLVGGIGIMNIMLVSVTERTREIGIRKAVGAKRKDILVQFLVEAIVLSVVGGAGGIVMGWGLGQIVNKLNVGITTIISPSSIMLAVGFSMLVGLFFGIYPATRAAALHPIDALRYE